MSAFEQLQQNPHYIRQVGESYIYDYHNSEDMYNIRRPRSSNLVATPSSQEPAAYPQQFQQPQNTLRKMPSTLPSNAYFPPALLRSWGIDPATHKVNAPKRLKRWFNSEFALPPPEPIPPKRGFKRVILWQDYTQDKVHAEMGIPKPKLGFGIPSYSRTRSNGV